MITRRQGTIVFKEKTKKKKKKINHVDLLNVDKLFGGKSFPIPEKTVDKSPNEMRKFSEVILQNFFI